MSEVKSGLSGLTHLSPAAPLLSSSLLFHCYHPRSHSSKQELLQILKKCKKKMGTHLTSPCLEMPQTSAQPIHGFGHGDLGLPMPGREAGKGL